MSAHATDNAPRVTARIQTYEGPAADFGANVPRTAYGGSQPSQGGLGLVATRFGASPIQHGAATGLSATAPNLSSRVTSLFETSRSTATPGPDGTPGSDGYAYYYGPDGQLYHALQDAVNSAVPSLGSRFTAGQLDDAINSKLRDSGLFNPDQLAAIQSGEQNAESHGTGFTETNKGGGNTAGFESSWLSNIASSLQNANPLAKKLTSNIDPPVTTPGQLMETPPSTPQDVGKSTADDIKSLLAASTGTGTGTGGGGGAPSALSNLPPGIATVGGSSGTNYPLVIGALALLGGGWYYMTHKHKHGGHKEAA